MFLATPKLIWDRRKVFFKGGVRLFFFVGYWDPFFGPILMGTSYFILLFVMVNCLTKAALDRNN